jgi:hypothetical protein
MHLDSKLSKKKIRLPYLELPTISFEVPVVFGIPEDSSGMFGESTEEASWEETTVVLLLL